MQELLFWIYLVNAVLLIDHEIDSAYWKEWELFKLPGGIGFFLVLHLPLLFLVLLGLVEVYKGSRGGLFFSLALGGVGIFAFCIHTYFIKKGKPGFQTPVSQFILYATLVVSLLQAGLTAYLITL